jgi:hypothetical protein
MAANTPIKFDLIANASDSLRRAVDLLAWDDFNSDHAKLKHAIVNAAHAIELLLKERLRRVHPAFVLQEVDKYPNILAITVSAATAVRRLKAIANIPISKTDEANLEAIRLTRNTIEHYEWHASETEARVIVGNALSFAFDFASEHLGIDLSEGFKKDDTWKMLIEQARDFAKAHGERLTSKAPNVFLITCDECGQETVTAIGSCILCGHWQEITI